MARKECICRICGSVFSAERKPARICNDHSELAAKCRRAQRRHLMARLRERRAENRNPEQTAPGPAVLDRPWGEPGWTFLLDEYEAGTPPEKVAYLCKRRVQDVIVQTRRAIIIGRRALLEMYYHNNPWQRSTARYAWPED